MEQVTIRLFKKKYSFDNVTFSKTERYKMYATVDVNNAVRQEFCESLASAAGSFITVYRKDMVIIGRLIRFSSTTGMFPVDSSSNGEAYVGGFTNFALEVNALKDR